MEAWNRPSRTPVDPGACAWVLPDPNDADHVGPRRRRRRPRAGDADRRLPRGLFPMPIGDGDALDIGLVVARPPRRHPARRPPRQPLAVQGDASDSRSASTPPSPRSCAPAPTRGATAAGSTTRSRRRTRELHDLGWAHSVEAWSRERASSPAACTASPSAGSSPASRCSTGGPTRRRSRSSALVERLAKRRRRAARLPVADPAPGLAGLRHRARARLPRATRRRPCMRPQLSLALKGSL